MKRRTLLARLGMIGVAIGGGWWLKDHVLWRPPRLTFGGAPEWRTFDARDEVLPTVRVDLGGRDVRALFDSGAQYSVIDRGLFDALGRTPTFDMPLLAYGVGGGAQLGKGTTLDLSLGTIGIEGLRAAILDLGPLAGPRGLGTPLILGQDVLGQALLDIQTDDKRLRLLPRDTPPPPTVVLTEARRKGRGLGADIRVEGGLIHAAIDTGSSAALSLSRTSAGALGLLDGRETRSGSSLVLGGSVDATVVEAAHMEFAGQTYRHVSTGIYADAGTPGFPAALVGMGAFEGRRVVLDLGGGRLWLSRLLDLTIGPM